MSSTTAVLAEKPSVARDIARVLGATQRGEGCLRGNGYIVTWAVGHLVGLPQPHQINADWKAWRRELLPMLPQHWPLTVSERTQSQFDIVSAILNAAEVNEVICATDAGREGELIFRYIYEAAGCAKPVRRLWLSSLTEDAIRQAFAQLRPGAEFDPLAAAARGRSQADWLVGLNLSRAYTLALNAQFGEVLSVGRVQTPTLAMLVERERAIRDFVPEDYFEVHAQFTLPAGDESSGPDASGTTGETAGGSYSGVWFRGAKPSTDSKRLEADTVEAEQICERVKTGVASVEKFQSQRKKQPPPQLYDLTELQRHANRLYAYDARTTLDIAQALYEKHKLISYPRTDSRYLSQTVADTLPAIVAALNTLYPTLILPDSGVKPLSKRFVDDSKVGDHHAIIPTALQARTDHLSQAEQRIYDLICRRVLAAWHADYEWLASTLITRVDSANNVTDRFHSTGSVVLALGWRCCENNPKTEDDADKTLPGGLGEGLAVDVTEVQPVKKTTRPPPRLNDATLLTAMESAGRQVDDKELADAMKETGLGTPATRAETIENLLRRGYLTRQGKILTVTEKGMALIEAVHAQVKSPAMTGEWEARLRRIERGEEALEPFLQSIEDYVRTVVNEVFTQPLPQVREPAGEYQRTGAGAAKADESAPSATGSPPVAHTARIGPVPPEKLHDLLREAFGLAAFRPHQEAVCHALLAGHDALVVMPTGAGKSLCYQLPGLALGGTTLVISPLIALMEDQVGKLQQLGLAAERIHSGRSREASRQVCKDYLAGHLDYLFIAPERLGVSGFPELLARRKPVLIAVDEAHCISQWGHDFRPDYRLLSQRLPLLRPARIIALTATATPRVQQDILDQLEIPDAQRHIHGFRRDNIAIEVAEVKRKQRAEVVQQLLASSERRPAIVYAPTRREAEELGDLLSQSMPAAAYHAGMTNEQRDQVQQGFLGGELAVIVATIAFGMGVDKADVRTVIHTGLPGSVEGYYQEIGRAGRDGKPSRAILLYSYADRRTHEFFLERDYPDPDLMHTIAQQLETKPQAPDELARTLRLDPELIQRATEKLCQYGGAQAQYDTTLVRAAGDWSSQYERQREHKQEQLDQVLRYASSRACRMLHLVQHFGGQADSGQPCGVCDACEPLACLVNCLRPPSPAESTMLGTIYQLLRQRDGLSTGQLFRQLESSAGRRVFERVLAGLAAAGVIRISADSFEKGGQTIHYQRAFLEPGVDFKPERILIPGTVDEIKPARSKAKSKANSPAAEPAASDAPLINALKQWRLNEARQRATPAYTILSNRVLTEIAISKPSSVDELLDISGVGQGTVEKFGPQILALVRGEEVA